LLVLLLIHIVTSIYYDFQPSDFATWTKTYGKKYENDEEYDKRYSSWKKSVDFINNENSKNKDYTLEPNFFADLTSEERQSFFKSSSLKSLRSPFPIGNHNEKYTHTLPETIDWRDKGAVTSVKDQGESCASSIIYATVGTIEAINVISNHAPLSNLSIQQLIDCCPSSGVGFCNGCYGNHFDPLYNYVLNAGGVESDADYPYQGINMKCKFDSSKVIATFSLFTSINNGDEQGLQRVLANHSPAAGACFVDNGFLFYKSGVYSSSACVTNNQNVDQGVLVVGYGVDATLNKEYYIVKLTWGVNWGESGYIRIARNAGNMCGVATFGYYAIV